MDPTRIQQSAGVCELNSKTMMNRWEFEKKMVSIGMSSFIRIVHHGISNSGI